MPATLKSAGVPAAQKSAGAPAALESLFKIVWGACGAKMADRKGKEDLVETAIFKSAYLKSGRS